MAEAPNDDKIVGEFRRYGKTFTVVNDGGYDIFTDKQLVQRKLTPDEFVRWACNALEDGS